MEIYIFSKSMKPQGRMIITKFRVISPSGNKWKTWNGADPMDFNYLSNDVLFKGKT